MWKRLRPVLPAAFLLAACGADRDRSRGRPESGSGFEHTVFTEAPPPQKGIATGELEQPAVRYEPIEVSPEYRHVLNFSMSPMLPPSRRPLATSGPLVLYGDDGETLVFSPMDHFFESLVELRDGRIEYGVEGEVDEIPEGFTHRFVLVEGRGIARTLRHWGDVLLADRGAERTDRYADRGLGYLGYWTDNGAYYYYRTEPDLDEHGTLVRVVEDARQRGIPLGYLQLDSWWYAKEGDGTNFAAGGLVRWEPKPGMFPEGLAAFQREIGLPLVLHNRWFAKDNDYRADFDFTEGEEMALPLERGVYDRFMEDAASWGAVTYEQDWLMTQFWGVPYLRDGVDHARDWYRGIHDAAADRDLTMQITMPGAAHLMATVDLAAITTVRTSIDYAPGIAKHAFWPQFHTVNLIAAALGVLPFKDNFWTGEPYGEAEALISVLSAGMVGAGDRLGEMDAELLLRTCRSDGLLLKPDRPAAPIDAMFFEHERPYTTVTWSDRPGVGRWTYLAAYRLAARELEVKDTTFAAIAYQGTEIGDQVVLPDVVRDLTVDLERDLDVGGEVVAYDWRAGEARVVEGTFELPQLDGLFAHAYVVLAPIFPNGLALLGETGKLVTVADRRFSGISYDEDSIVADVEGVAGETVTLRAFDATSDALLPAVTREIGPDGTARITLAR